MSTSTTESAYLGVPGFVPGTLSATTLLSVYGLSSLFVVSIVWLFSGRSTKIDRVIMCWWAFTGLTHMILEGYFVFTPDFFKDTTGHFLKEVWKEYSKGDLRYALRDSAIVTVEGLTAVLEGPACILAVYAIATKKSYSHVLQLAIALGQLYGTFVYYITAILDGDNYSATPYHYYAYYIGANAWWLLIPSLIAIRSWKKICAAFEARNNRNKTKARRD
ncbi:putative 3-beta-hydroxysteroid-Delta(8),Delta(7)-isomerase [Drosera capensis]